MNLRKLFLKSNLMKLKMTPPQKKKTKKPDHKKTPLSGISCFYSIKTDLLNLAFSNFALDIFLKVSWLPPAFHFDNQGVS